MTRAISILLAVVFVPSGLAKLVGVAQLVENFRRWGYPPWFILVIGAAEVLAGALVAVPRTRRVGALALVGIMLGAIRTHVVIEPLWPAAALCVALAAMSAYAGLARD